MTGFVLLCEGESHFQRDMVDRRIAGDYTRATVEFTYYDDKFGGTVTKALCAACLVIAQRMIDTESAMAGTVKPL